MVAVVKLNDEHCVVDAVQDYYDSGETGNLNWMVTGRSSHSQFCTTMSIRRSGLQREVLALYRRSVFSNQLPESDFIYTNRALRMVLTKPPTTQPKFHLFVRYTFRTQASSVSPRDVAAIEHLLRKGRRQLDGLEETSVKDCWVSKEMEEWDRRTRVEGHGNIE